MRIYNIFVDLPNLTKMKNLNRHLFVTLSIHKPFLEPCEDLYKIWARSVKPFWRLSVTNKQTNTQTSKVFIYISIFFSDFKRTVIFIKPHLKSFIKSDVKSHVKSYVKPVITILLNNLLFKEKGFIHVSFKFWINSFNKS